MTTQYLRNFRVTTVIVVGIAYTTQMSKVMTCGRDAANTIRVTTRALCMATYADSSKVTNNLEQPDCFESIIQNGNELQMSNTSNIENIGRQVICDMSQSKHFMKEHPVGNEDGHHTSSRKNGSKCHCNMERYPTDN